MHLPKSPNDKQKYSYLEQNKTFLYIFGVFSLLCLCAGMIFFSLADPLFYWYICFPLVLLGYLSISYIVGLFGKNFDYEEHWDVIQRHPGVNHAKTVDVFLPCCGEDIEILKNTYEHVSKLDWDPALLNVYVLDDKGSPEVEAAAKEHAFHYLSRENKGEMKKAGNLKFGFEQSKGDYILILDADFCPRPDMLRDTVPWMVEDEKIGIVQTPQYFCTNSSRGWVQKGAAYVQELFYRLIQVNRNTWGASICVGTCGLYRREALAEFGGTAQIGYSEDLHTGFMLLQGGWKVRFLPINMAAGVCPDDLKTFFTQQYRWAMGSTSLCFNKDFWKTKLNLWQRLSFLSGMIYYQATALGIFLSPIPALMVLFFRPDLIHWYNWAFVVPSFIFSTVYMALWSKAKFGLYALTSRHASYWAHLFALIDKLRANKMPWISTGAKSGKNNRFEWFKRGIFSWTTLVAVVTGIGLYTTMPSLLAYDFYPLIFFTVLNTFVGYAALFKK